MSIYLQQRIGDQVTLRQSELPSLRLRSVQAYGSDRLGLVRRDLLLDTKYVCEGCGDPQEGGGPDPGQLRISEALYDSPLNRSKENTHVGEYAVLRNTSGRDLPLAGVELWGGTDHMDFDSTDTLGEGRAILVVYGTSAEQQDMLSADNLPQSLTSDPDISWRWQTDFKMPDAEGGLVLKGRDGNGQPQTLDQVWWGSEGLSAPNAHCDTTCQQDTARPPVLALRLADFTWDPAEPYKESNWQTAEATGKGGGMQPETATATRALAHKEYELKDHLGNVRVVVTDLKHSDVGGGTPHDFMADVRVMRDHYPFGMQMEGQVYAASDYRYGFNGMERDDEVHGEGSSYDFGARMYDPRVGRWWSVDPKALNFSHATPYNCNGNSPILFIDMNGKEIFVSGESEYDRSMLEALTRITGFKIEIKDGKLVAGQRIGNPKIFGGTILKLISDKDVQHTIALGKISGENRVTSYQQSIDDGVQTFDGAMFSDSDDLFIGHLFSHEIIEQYSFKRRKLKDQSATPHYGKDHLVALVQDLEAISKDAGLAFSSQDVLKEGLENGAAGLDELAVETQGGYMKTDGVKREVRLYYQDSQRNTILLSYKLDENEQINNLDVLYTKNSSGGNVKDIGDLTRIKGEKGEQNISFKKIE